MVGKKAADAIMKIRPHATILLQDAYPADSMQQKKLSYTAEHFLYKAISAGISRGGSRGA